jgi:hypothetical protein
VYLGPRQPEELTGEIAAWQSVGATHLNVRTSSYPVQWRDGKVIRKSDVHEHIEALRRVKAATWTRRTA